MARHGKVHAVWLVSITLIMGFSVVSLVHEYASLPPSQRPISYTARCTETMNAPIAEAEQARAQQEARVKAAFSVWATLGYITLFVPCVLMTTVILLLGIFAVLLLCKGLSMELVRQI